MIKHCPPVDRDFPFVSGLHELLSEGFGCCRKGIGDLCRELTNKYILPVEPIGEVKGDYGTYYLRVPERLTEVQIGWIHEVLSYHKTIGVQLILVQSDEHHSILLGVLQLEFDIEKEIKTLLSKERKVPWNDDGIALIQRRFKSALDQINLGECEITPITEGRRLNIVAKWCVPETRVNITGTIKL